MMVNDHGRRKDFFQGGGSRGFSQNIFQGGPKVVEFVFYPSKLKKQPFFANFKIQGGQSPPSDAYVNDQDFSVFFQKAFFFIELT